MIYAAIAIFTISLVAIITMVCLRIVELRKRRAFFSTRILNTIDWVLNKKATWFKAHVYSYVLRVVFFLFSWTKMYSMAILRSLRTRADTAILRLIIWLRGKRILLKNKGSVSFFLRNISEHNKDWDGE